MKSLPILSLMLLSMTSAAYGQATKLDHQTLEARIIALDRQGWEAWKHNDASWLQKNTTKQFMSISADGVSDKAQVIAATPTQCQVKSVSLDQFKFAVLDANAVLLTYVATQDAVCDGKKAPASVRATVNYVKRGNRWLEAMYMQSP
ncbi:MAG: nuclear transport factor 2 family protein [Rudaea sp.]